MEDGPVPGGQGGQGAPRQPPPGSIQITQEESDAIQRVLIK